MPNLITAVGTAILAIGTIIMAIIAFFALRSEMRMSRSEVHMSRRALQAETLLSLDARFYSTKMIKSRQEAAKKLLASNPNNHELADVLDFLTTVALLADREVIDPELTYESFVYWMVRYWLAAKSFRGKSYVAIVRESDEESWRKLEELVKKQVKEEELKYSDEYLKVFLYEEARFDNFSEKPLEIKST